MRNNTSVKIIQKFKSSFNAWVRPIAGLTQGKVFNVLGRLRGHPVNPRVLTKHFNKMCVELIEALSGEHLPDAVLAPDVTRFCSAFVTFRTES